MYGNGRKTIGVFICRAVNHFQKELCRGISARCRSLGYNVAFFSWLGNFLTDIDYSEGDRMILDLPDYKELSGIVVALDTVDEPGMKKDLMQKLHECKDMGIPVVSIRVESDFYDIMVDNNRSMEDMIRHFIDHHHYKDICFLSGWRGFADTDQRLECFKRIMEEKGLPVEDNQIYYSGLWKFDGAPACRQFIDERGHVPDAILCSNDYTGISVCNELMERGLRVPEDVAVCGYDGIAETAACTPTLSTVQVPFYEMGLEAVNIISDVNHGVEREKTFWCKVYNTFRSSCGCDDPITRESLHKKKLYYEELEISREEGMRNAYMAVDLGRAQKMADIRKILNRHLRYFSGWNQIGLFMIPSVEERKEPIDYRKGFGDEILMQFLAKRGQKKPKGGIVFQKSDLLPTEILDEEPQVWYFISLPYRNKSFGYLALEAGESAGYSSALHNIIVNLGMAVEAMFSRNKLTILIDELEDMHVRDVLTGLYNRRGYEKFGDNLFQKAKKEKRKIFVSMIDLDGLKTINDNFGHSEGDFALCEIARAMEECGNGKQICARMGGDEYSVIDLCDEKESRQYVEQFYQYLEETNKQLKKKYNITASFGYVCCVPKDKDTLESLLKRSDHRMYERKLEHKKTDKYNIIKEL